MSYISQQENFPESMETWSQWKEKTKSEVFYPGISQPADNQTIKEPVDLNQSPAVKLL